MSTQKLDCLVPSEDTVQSAAPHGLLNARDTNLPIAAQNSRLKLRSVHLKAELVPLHKIEPVLTSRYLVKGLLDRSALSVVYGDSNAGKTFVALDLAVHVAAGADWHGRPTACGKSDAGAVVYVAGEGGTGIQNRLMAIRAAYPHLDQLCEKYNSFFLLQATLDLCTGDDADCLAEALAKIGIPIALIVIDTLARAMGSGDENTAKDMGALVRNVDDLRADTGAHVMIIHHSGKDASRGARGSNSLRAAVDTEIEVTRHGSVIAATARKQRDMSVDQEVTFKLRKVALGTDEDECEVTSAVIEKTDAVEKRQSLRGATLTALDVLDDLLPICGKVKSGSGYPKTARCVPVDVWRKACAERRLTKGKCQSAPSTAFTRASNALEEQKIIAIADGYVWKRDDERGL